MPSPRKVLETKQGVIRIEELSNTEFKIAVLRKLNEREENPNVSIHQ
jgi:hypothetical protein